MEFTKEQIAKGFEKWEKQWREGSKQFYSDTEKAALTLEEYGKKSADYLVDLMVAQK